MSGTLTVLGRWLQRLCLLVVDKTPPTRPPDREVGGINKEYLDCTQLYCLWMSLLRKYRLSLALSQTTQPVWGLPHVGKPEKHYGLLFIAAQELLWETRGLYLSGTNQEELGKGAHKLGLSSQHWKERGLPTILESLHFATGGWGP